MKISSRIDGSICGAILSNRPLSNSATAQYLGNGWFEARGRVSSIWTRHEHLRSIRHSSWRGGSACFISSAATLNRLSTPRQHNDTTPYFKSTTPNTSCSNHTSAAVAEPTQSVPTPPFPARSRKELLALVDQYDSDTVDDHFEFHRDTYLRGYAPANGPNLVISNKQEDISFPSDDQRRAGNEEHQQILQNLRKAVLLRLRSPYKASLDDIYRTYCQLPEPRMAYLHWRLRAQLLRALGTIERKDTKSMLRYFSLVADVKNSGLSLTRAQWNTAISFASRYVGVSTDVEAESALSLWREMEQDAGIRADDVTFNILFDVASKAGKFTLAEMMYKEMECRGYTFNRYHHVSLIHFFGLKMDGGGVRAAYKEMVEAGEMIDNVVLNCVMAGLLRSGEESAAEGIYERMKESHPKASEMPERSYVANKVVTKVLMMFAKVGREHPSMRAAFQALSPISPDLQTYRILVGHFAVKVGDLNKVAQYLDEMRWFRVQLHGAIFLALFKGFHAHGGFVGSDWSEQRLQSVWAAFLQAFDEGAAGLYIHTWLASWALRAFAKCSSREMILRAYDDLSARWDLDQADTDFMMSFLHDLLKKSALHRPAYLASPERGQAQTRFLSAPAGLSTNASDLG